MYQCALHIGRIGRIAALAYRHAELAFVGCFARLRRCDRGSGWFRHMMFAGSAQQDGVQNGTHFGTDLLQNAHSKAGHDAQVTSRCHRLLGQLCAKVLNKTVYSSATPPAGRFQPLSLWPFPCLEHLHDSINQPSHRCWWVLLTDFLTMPDDILQITPHMPQLQNLQKVEVLRQAISRSTSRILKIPRLRQVWSNFQYKLIYRFN